MVRKKYIKCLLIAFMFITIFTFQPKSIFAWNVTSGTNLTYELSSDSDIQEMDDLYHNRNGIKNAEYSTGFTLNSTDTGGTYYLRYDITSLEITNDYKMQINGWAIIKDYNNGKEGTFAPIYYLRVYDISNPIKEKIYKHEANKNGPFRAYELNEVNDGRENGYEVNGTTYKPLPTTENDCGVDNADRGTGYSEYYDNTEFVFDNINLYDSFFKNASENVELGVQLMIYIPKQDGIVCTGVRTSWFNIGIYDITAQNRNKKLNNLTNGKVYIESSNDVKFVAKNVGGFNPDTIYRVTDIEDIETKSGNGTWGIKFNYKIEGKDKKAKSTWVQNDPDNVIRISYNPSCANTDPTTPEGRVCCTNDRSYAERNQEYCCDNNLVNDDYASEICCAGTYGYKYSSVNKNACCEYLPETCCDNTNFVNTNWERNWVYQNGGVCCGDSKLQYKYTGNTYYFDTFKTKNLTTQIQNKCSSNTLNGKVCLGNTNSKNSESKTLKFDYNGTKIEMSDSVTIDVGERISELNVNDNIGYTISPNINGLNLSGLHIEIKNSDITYSGNNVKINFKYIVDAGYESAHYNINIKITLCYDSTNSITDCNDLTFKKNNPAICSPPTPPANTDPGPYKEQPDNLSCDSNGSKITKTLNQNNRYNDYGAIVRCTETLSLTNYKTSSELETNILYSGTGFKYNLTVEDKIICKADYSGLKTFSSANAIDTAESKLNSNMKEAIDYFSDVRRDNSISNFKFVSGSTTKQYIINSNSSNNDLGTIHEEQIKKRVKYTKWNSGTHNFDNASRDVWLTNKIERTATYDIQLPMQYIDIMSGEIYDTNGTNRIEAGNKYYTKVDDATGFYNFSIKLNGAGLSGDITNSFTCSYGVENILTTGGKIEGGSVQPNYGNNNYLTRPISLSKPFNTVPNSTGRATNWYNFYSNANTRYITDTSTEIYTKPMYEFTLTPGNINEIQKYNKNHSGYNSWNFADNFNINTCSDSLGQNVSCRTSKFVSCLTGSQSDCSNLGLSNTFTQTGNFNSGNNNNAHDISNRSDKTGFWS